MSRRRVYLVATAILVGCIAVAVSLVAIRPEPARQPAPSRIPFATTASVIAGEGAIPVYGSGTVRPRAEVEVVAEVAGRVVWIAPNFRSGRRIQQGQVLFRIDDADYQHRVEQAHASVALQEVELLRVTAEAEVAQLQRESLKGLQLAEVSAAEPGPLASWEPQLEAAKAALARDRAALKEAELGLSRTKVLAPFTGVVAEESVAMGQFVRPGHSVGRLYAADAVEVAVPLPDARAALIPDLWNPAASRRVPARVIADYGGEGHFMWKGYVDRAEAVLDAQTRTIEVIVRVPNPLRGGSRISAHNDDTGRVPLLVGKFVDVEMEGHTPDTYFRVSRAALKTGNEVWVVRDSTLHIVPVRVLQRLDDEVLLTGALEAGQTIVISGVVTAVEGMRVRTGS